MRVTNSMPLESTFFFSHGKFRRNTEGSFIIMQTKANHERCHHIDDVTQH
jgi:hypothetical protein